MIDLGAGACQIITGVAPTDAAPPCTISGNWKAKYRTAKAVKTAFADGQQPHTPHHSGTLSTNFDIGHGAGCRAEVSVRSHGASVAG